MHTAPTAPTPPLERARDRLRLSAAIGHACYDDLAAPGWASYRSSRARFLGRPEPRISPDAEESPPIPPSDGR